ncbi:MFS transporter [bacterium BMS3Abin03]|jgi:proton-dependent oligopeptide transporter, POT family|nr:MFS transporter [bacterium BMS3Abin03]MCG6959126.1 MFS transporter [bacterium BMS3Abin03]
MSDLIIVFIGLGVILYFFFVLGTGRVAIQKGQNGLLWFLVSLVLPPVAYFIVLSASKKEKADGEPDFFENIIMELTQPFVDLSKTSRALLGVNISYVLEGLTYFGVLGLLAIFFNQYIGLDDIDAGRMVGILTAGITIAMLFLGATVDWIGLRKSLLIALSLMLVGRVFLSISPSVGVPGLWGSAHVFAMIGIFGIILGYGIYQPACYAGVKQLTNKKTAAMGYAMLYALMNLGGFLPGIISPPVRKAFEITGVFWVYVALTVVGIGVVYFLITKKAMKKAISDLEKTKETKSTEKDSEEETGFKLFVQAFSKQFKSKRKSSIVSIYVFVLLMLIVIAKEFFASSLIEKSFSNNIVLSSLFGFNWFIALALIGLSILIYIITDLRFFYFIFILIFVQTLFAHNWLTIPQYTSRAFEGFISENFEFFVNLNPILIFILTPMVTALTSKKDTYNMMIIGTAVMASPTFILVLGPNFDTLIAYIIIMTIGEAMWQPRFLQWVAEIAPKNMTGIYMGIGQFPWFLTKVITSLYSGWFLMKYCPINTLPSEMNTETMWLIYGIIAIISPVGLLLAKGWMKKGFKDKADDY